MKKAIFVVVSMAFISVILLGCQSQDNTTPNTTKPEQQTEVADKSKVNEQSEDNDKIILEGDISKITFRNLHDNNYIIFDKANDIEFIKNIITSAEKELGIVNIASPDYRVKVVFTDGNEDAFFNLWVGDKGMKSVLMRLEESETIYTTSEEMTDQLINLIEK